MATGSDTGLFRAIARETGRTGDEEGRRGADHRGVDGEGVHLKMSASRRDTEAYFADSRRDVGRDYDKETFRYSGKDDDLDYKEVKKEAKAEFRKIKESAVRVYEKRLEEARGEFLRNAVRSREQYQLAKDGARRELEQLLADAREQYEFTIDMARDLKVGLRGLTAGGGRSKKTTRKIAKEVEASVGRGNGRSRAANLDEELRQAMLHKGGDA